MVTATELAGSVAVTIDVTTIGELQPLTGPATVDYEESGAGRVAAYSASSSKVTLAVLSASIVSAQVVAVSLALQPSPHEATR